MIRRIAQHTSNVNQNFQWKFLAVKIDLPNDQKSNYFRHMSEPKIQKLHKDVVNKIAAGEIVERPAAIVKELIENSIDAKATAINVSFQKGGKFNIVIEDNGIGMSLDNAILSLERHATSKFSTFDDFDTLTTFGFRGEALPSIASVSQFSITTRTKNCNLGHTIAVQDGNIISTQTCQCPNGTKIEVKNLFYNVPARRKFLKSDETETSHIINIVKQFALTEPNITFNIINNGNHIFQSPEQGSLSDRFNKIFGYNEKFIPFHHDDEKYKIHGIICSPDFGEFCRKNILTYVNQRIVKSDIISSSICDATKGLYPHHREILACIFVEINASLLDVNVHPMKREVRFKDETPLRQSITLAIQSALNRAQDESQQHRLQSSNTNKHYTTFTQPKSDDNIHYQNLQPKPNIAQKEVKQQPIQPQQVNSRLYQQSSLKIHEQESSTWRWIGHAYDNIYLFESTTGIVFFNAKSALSRITYEEIMSDEYQASQQQLLLPINIKIAAHETEQFEQILPVLNNIGFSIYLCGQCEYKISATPSWTNYQDIPSIITQLTEGMNQNTNKKPCNMKTFCARILSNNVNTSIDTQNLSTTIQSICDKLLQCQNPLTSPNGNAIYFEVRKYDIQKRI